MNPTSLHNAFDFNSTIKPAQTKSIYSSICIFCHHAQSRALMPDGSFRQCSNCKKQFKAPMIQANQNTLFQNSSYSQPLFPTMRPNYMPPR